MDFVYGSVNEFFNHENRQNLTTIKYLVKIKRLFQIQNSTKQQMIPGKVFFESISISQELSKRYQIYLLLNGIFYDKIKLFQTKYMCLTVNDVLEVELSLNPLKNDPYEEQKSNKQNVRNVNTSSSQKSILKITIPYSYKLMIENKTIDIKYQLNGQNNHQDIKINLAFQPVASFNRKKLGATMSPNKNRSKLANINPNFHNISQSSSSHPDNFDQSSAGTPYDNFYPENLDFSRKNTGKSASINNNFHYQPQKQIFTSSMNMKVSQISKSLNTTKQKMKMLIYNEQLYKDRVIQNQTQSEEHSERDQIIDYGRSLKKQKQFKQNLIKIDEQFNLRKNKIESTLNNFNQFLESAQNKNLRAQTRDQIIHDPNNNFILNGNQESSATGSQAHNKDIELDYRSSGMTSQFDTLQSLAYQREKILGQLFGKFNKNSK